jgi:hypothetical protein
MNEGEMMVRADPQAWAEETFGQAQLGDPRRTRRLVACAAQIACQPEKSFPQIFDWNQLRAFYNLCGRSEARLQTIQQPHWLATRAAMAQQPLVLILHDTTVLDFTSHKALQGRGPIGNGGGRGFLQHNSLAFLPQGSRLLGLVSQQLYVRRQAPPKETRRARKKRQRETLLWLEGIRASGTPPTGCRFVDVGDRGADIYEAMEAAVQLGHDFLWRVGQDRVVYTDAAQTQEAYLKRYARSLASVGQDVVDVPGRGGRPPRQARVQLTCAPVWVPAPCTVARRRSRPVLACWVVRIWEADPPVGIKKPLDWILLSSVPTRTLAQMQERRDWYALRWSVEVYHDIEKNGCREETRRFETAAAMDACLGVLGVVAVRIYQLRLALEEQPEAPASAVATSEEIEVLTLSAGTAPAPRTVRDVIVAVAKLGGFLGRKSDGLPGVRSLWRGYQRLQDRVAGYRLRQRPHNKSP